MYISPDIALDVASRPRLTPAAVVCLPFVSSLLVLIMGGDFKP